MKMNNSKMILQNGLTHKIRHNINTSQTYKLSMTELSLNQINEEYDGIHSFPSVISSIASRPHVRLSATSASQKITPQTSNCKNTIRTFECNFSFAIAIRYERFITASPAMTREEERHFFFAVRQFHSFHVV